MTARENIISVITRKDPGWIPYRYDGCLTMLKPNIVVRPVQGGLDDWNVNWIGTSETEGSYPDGKPVIDIDRIEELQVPTTDFHKVTERMRESVRGLADQDTLIIGYNELTLFERAEQLLGFDNFLMATALKPARVKQLLDTITAYQQRLTEATLRAGVSGIRFTDDWGTQASLFISPENWRQLIKPGMKRLYETVKKYGAFVFQHSCGHIEEIVPDLIEIGVDVLDPCQPKANDIFRWKKEYGDGLSFMGGLDTQGYLGFGDPGFVREKVKEVASIMSEGGGYIAAPSHTITIPEDNKNAMLDALDELNQKQWGYR